MANQLINRPKRWDSPFDDAMTKASVKRVLGQALFAKMDQDKFPKRLPLHLIIQNDTRIRKYRKGDLIVRAGDYGNSAFLVLSGEVCVILPPGLSRDDLGHRSTKRRGRISTIWQYLTRSKYPEVRSYGGKNDKAQISLRGVGQGTQVYFKDVDAILSVHETSLLKVDDMFGEVAALARTPRNASIVATQEVELLEIRWQAIRDIRRQVHSFRQYTDDLYRERNLLTHLKKISSFKHLSDDVLSEIAQETLFESYGSFDWHTAFKRKKVQGNLRSTDGETRIAAQGDYPDGLIFVRSGFAKITKRINHGEKTISVLSEGGVFGLEEILHNTDHSSDDDKITFQTGLIALGYADILRVPTRTIELKVLPNLSDNDIQNLFKDFESVSNLGDEKNQLTERDAEFLEFSVDHRFINGTAAMMIDLERCVHCDECVHACASTHNGNPRFIRHGKQHNHQMVANACMHCVDPVCMIGCPTGAIHRSESAGEVIINDAACIGCGTCANSCPYDNIRLVEIRNNKGEVLIDSNENTPLLKATKCDLCFDLPHGPACQTACPHDALVRINMSDSLTLSKRLNA